jgi:hypothetical protein
MSISRRAWSFGHIGGSRNEAELAGRLRCRSSRALSTSSSSPAFRPCGTADSPVALFLETTGAAFGDVAPTEEMSAMDDLLEMRDDDCWACIIRELRKANHEALANDLRTALDSPTDQDAMATFQAKHPDYQLRTAPVAELCRFAGTCRW